jgi:hypothetical protein
MTWRTYCRKNSKPVEFEAKAIQVCLFGADKLTSKEYLHCPNMNKLAHLKLLLLAAVVGLLSGCASLLNDDSQDLTVKLWCKNKPIMATCFAENEKGRWVFSAPGMVRVKNDYSALNISCKGQYVERFTVSAPALPSLAMAGNVLLGGLVGAAVDVYNSTGLKYPDNIDISNPACE